MNLSCSFCLIFLFYLAINSCSSNNTNEAKKEVTGKELYEMNCALCHGTDGKLGLSGAKDLTQSVLTQKEKKAVIINGSQNKTMLPFGKINGGPLNNEEVDKVLKYINQL